MYGDGGGKLPITNMIDPIDITIERMRSKDPEMVLIPGKNISLFVVKENLVEHSNENVKLTELIYSSRFKYFQRI